MHKSVQDFLQLVQPGTYFETPYGRFIFVKRVNGGFGYDIRWQVLGGVWVPIAAFKVMGPLQPGKQRHVNLIEFGLEE
jgi:hypothetical protein